MIKSLKGQFILSIITAICFIYLVLSYTDFTGEAKFSRILFFTAMILSVYNTGMLTQKYIKSKKS
ncbi:hypothetical protein BTO28_06485 [Domibacillus epiphyticus]|uniref:Uncharacterized protein n=1 Tax=Domibacillus epiphyticus TaxID=1714355 RepID=A0A1V2A9E5_9BACI|nr:hypothetical protein BTO28_06485 [Domibacillus epiphyticus]